MANHYRITIFDINFILSFIGFVFFTTFFPFLNSIAIRAICLGVSLVCISITGISPKTHSKQANIYLVLLLVIVLRTTIDLLFGSLSEASGGGKMLVFLFMYGLMLIPLISIISSLSKINWSFCLLISQIILGVVIFQGVLTANVSDVYVLNNGRIGLNDRQGTIQFSTNSAYLLILSLVMYVNTPFTKTFLNNCCKIVAIVGVVLAFVGLAKASSRGPFLASLLVIVFYLYNITSHFKYWLLGIIGFITICSSSILLFFKDFAPILFDRLLFTMESGDENRRAFLNNGIERFLDNPILGDNPLIIWDSGFAGLHNMYLDVALFLGGFGFLIFVFLYVVLFKDILSQKTNSPAPLFFYLLFVYFVIRGFSGLCLVNDSLISLSFIISSLYVRKRKLLNLNYSEHSCK